MKYLWVAVFLLVGCEAKQQPQELEMAVRRSGDATLVVNMSSRKKVRGSDRRYAESILIFDPPLEVEDQRVKFFYRESEYDCKTGTSTLRDVMVVDDQNRQHSDPQLEGATQTPTQAEIELVCDPTVTLDEEAPSPEEI